MSNYSYTNGMTLETNRAHYNGIVRAFEDQITKNESCVHKPQKYNGSLTAMSRTCFDLGYVLGYIMYDRLGLPRNLERVRIIIEVTNVKHTTREEKKPILSHSRTDHFGTVSAPSCDTVISSYVTLHGISFTYSVSIYEVKDQGAGNRCVLHMEKNFFKPDTSNCPYNVPRECDEEIDLAEVFHIASNFAEPHMASDTVSDCFTTPIEQTTYLLGNKIIDRIIGSNKTIQRIVATLRDCVTYFDTANAFDSHIGGQYVPYAPELDHKMDVGEVTQWMGVTGIGSDKLEDMEDNMTESAPFSMKNAKALTRFLDFQLRKTLKLDASEKIPRSIESVTMWIFLHSRVLSTIELVYKQLCDEMVFALLESSPHIKNSIVETMTNGSVKMSKLLHSASLHGTEPKGYSEEHYDHTTVSIGVRIGDESHDVCWQASEPINNQKKIIFNGNPILFDLTIQNLMSVFSLMSTDGEHPTFADTDVPNIRVDIAHSVFQTDPMLVCLGASTPKGIAVAHSFYFNSGVEMEFFITASRIPGVKESQRLMDRMPPEMASMCADFRNMALESQSEVAICIIPVMQAICAQLNISADCLHSTELRNRLVTLATNTGFALSSLKPPLTVHGGKSVSSEERMQMLINNLDDLEIAVNTIRTNRDKKRAREEIKEELQQKKQEIKELEEENSKLKAQIHFSHRQPSAYRSLASVNQKPHENTAAMADDGMEDAEESNGESNGDDNGKDKENKDKKNGSPFHAFMEATKEESCVSGILLSVGDKCLNRIGTANIADVDGDDYSPASLRKVEKEEREAQSTRARRIVNMFISSSKKTSTPFEGSCIVLSAAGFHYPQFLVDNLMRGGKNPIDKFTKMQALAARIVNDM
jgi:hypothetical protein